MGGKGQRRREKNYRVAHGGHLRLPPPPDLSQIDALPSKLRKLMSVSSTTPQRKRKRDGKAHPQKKCMREDAIDLEAATVKNEGDDENVVMRKEDVDGDVRDIKGEKRKKKRKKKQVDDLRFELVMDKTGQKRRERRKKYLEAKKKKKQKKSEAENELNFPGHEHIIFGDVVQAPPKLVALPKALKNVQDASRERLRLQAIEAYRNRKGWTSRPGLKLPPPVTTTPTL